MKRNLTVPRTLRGSRAQRLMVTAAALAAMSLCGSLRAALPTPLVEFRFSEPEGALAANTGSLGGAASLMQPDDYPLFTNNVPAGIFAPGGNTAALDFGGILAGQGGRALDLTAASGDGSLGALSAFTVCGWLNARDLTEGWGGNRIAWTIPRAKSARPAR